MDYFLIPKNKLSGKNLESNEWNSKGMFKDLERELNEAKFKQDDYYETKKFRESVGIFDIFRQEKNKLKKKFNAQNVTNAWLKIYEICDFFALIPQSKKKLTHFDNAAFPGAFVLAVNHYVQTRTKINDYNWYASSFVGKEGLLKDSYGLYILHRKHWLMKPNRGISGDVTEMKNQNHWETFFNHSVDLYTSDLGFETDEHGDYTKQEFAHLKPNIGQILTGLLTLRNGGHMVIKQYTFFESLNISVIALLTNCFEEVYLCKPVTSRPFNSETYIVCKIYRYSGNIIEKFKSKLEAFNVLPLISFKSITVPFMSMIKKAAFTFFKKQIYFLNKRLDWYDKLKHLNLHDLRQQGRIAIKPWHNKVISKWYKLHKFRRIKNKKKIKLIRNF